MRTSSALLLLALVAPASAGAADVVPLATGERKFTAWAIDEATGGIYGALPATGRVVEFDPETGAERRSFGCRLLRWGTDFTFKGGRLVVGHLSEPSVLGFDIATGERTFELQLGAPLISPLLIAAARPEPWIWLLTGTDRGDVKLVRVDVVAGAAAAVASIELGARDFRGASLSPDGRLLLVTDTYRAHLFSLEGDDEGACLIRSFDDMALRPGPIDRDPRSGEWVTCGRVLAADLGSPSGHATAGFLAFHPRRDLSLCARGHSLQLRRASSDEEIATIPDALFSDHGIRAQVDAVRERALLTHERGARVVSLAHVQVSTPLTLTVTPQVVVARPGERISVQVASSAGEAAAELTLVDPPSGVSLTGEGLTWTPSPEHVGLHQLRVAGRRGAEQHEAGVFVHVRLPSVRVSFQVGRIVVDAAGQRALVSTAATWASRSRERAPRLAVVDLGRATLGGELELERDASALALTEETVFVFLRGPDIARRLSASDLADQGQSFHPGVVDAAVLGRRVVGLLDPSREGAAVALDAGTLAEVWRVPAPGGSSSPGLARTLSGGLLLGGAYVRADGELRGLSRHLLHAAALTAPPAPSHPGREGGRPYYAPRHPSLPVAFTARSVAKDQRLHVMLEVRDLIEDRVVLELPVSRVSGRYNPVHSDWTPPIAAAGDRVVIAVGDRVHVLSLPVERLGAVPRPLELEPAFERPPTLRHTDPPATLPVAAGGGAAEVRFSLEGAVPGVTVDAANGAVTVDPGAAWRHFLSSIKGPPGWQDDRVRPYCKLLGLDDDSFLVFVEARVAARDARQQQASTAVVAVVQGPMAEVTAAWEAIEARAAAERRQQALQQQAAGEPGAAAALQALRHELDVVRLEGGQRVTSLTAELAHVREALDALRAERQDAGGGGDLDALRRDLDALRRELEAARKEPREPAPAGTPVEGAPSPLSVPGVLLGGLVLAIAAFALGRTSRSSTPPAVR
ncbi:MAG: hypothetical protein M9894_04690 [Planctomycetes bacterium]|nr:hypothetical protein [Planctomycetota bacterium]